MKNITESLKQTCEIEKQAHEMTKFPYMVIMYQMTMCFI